MSICFLIDSLVGFYRSITERNDNNSAVVRVQVTSSQVVVRMKLAGAESGFDWVRWRGVTVIIFADEIFRCGSEVCIRWISDINVAISVITPEAQ